MAFTSKADDLVPGDTNDDLDVFVYDRQTQTMERASVTNGGAQAGGKSEDAAISGDGRYVAFSSNAALAPGIELWSGHVYVRDKQLGTTELVSKDSAGVPASRVGESIAQSTPRAITADGRFVVFQSTGDNLVAGGTNGQEVFVHDRTTGTTVLISTDSIGNEGDGTSYGREISDDGRYVSFYSKATNLVAGDTNGAIDTFRHDRQTGVTELVSLDGASNTLTLGGLGGKMSPDGRYLGFASSDPTLPGVSTYGTQQAYVRDMQTGALTHVSVSSDGDPADSDVFPPEITADGSLAVFISDAENLVRYSEPPPAQREQVFARDLGRSLTEIVSGWGWYGDATGGNGSVGTSFVEPSITPDGLLVAFQSRATEFDPPDANGSTHDIFVKERCIDPLDYDCDGVVDAADNCIGAPNPGQENLVHPGTADGDHCEDADSDSVYDLSDNCPDVVNLDQDDADSDLTGDACDQGDSDGDLLADFAEYYCKSEASDAGIIPERLDLPTDDDGDTVADEPLPDYTDPYDCDGDGYTGTVELHVFSDSGVAGQKQDPCGADGWPSDIVAGGVPDSTNRVNILDLASFVVPTRYLGTDVGTNPGDVRWDLAPGPGPLAVDINVLDIAAMTAPGSATGAPPMLGGDRAFLGPDCPWVP